MNFKVSAVILLKGTPTDPVTDAYGMTTTCHAADEKMVNKTYDLVLHSEVSVEEFLKYWLNERLVHARQVDSCVKMFGGWLRDGVAKPFLFETNNRQSKRINVQISTVAE